LATLITDDIRAAIGRREAPVHLLVTRATSSSTPPRPGSVSRNTCAATRRRRCSCSAPTAPSARSRTSAPTVCARDTLTPELPLKRVMAGGIRQRYHRPIRPGDELVIEKSISDIFEKQGSSGPLIFVVCTLTVKDTSGALVLEETQTRINR
jgi:hypothetical protein